MNIVVWYITTLGNMSSRRMIIKETPYNIFTYILELQLPTTHLQRELSCPLDPFGFTFLTEIITFK